MSCFVSKKGHDRQDIDNRREKEKAEMHSIASFKDPNLFLAVHPLSNQQPWCPLPKTKD
jgi:hypothetical protein